MKLQDCELIQKLRDMVGNERELLTEILRHLREVERRQLFLERGYSSMFAFCIEALGYSEQEAHVRIQAMRLMSAVPMVEEKIESGELSLSVAAKVQSNFRRANTPAEEKEEVIESVLCKSARQADRELAERFPKAPKPEVERAVAGGRTYVGFEISNECFEKLKRLKERAAHTNFESRLGVLFEELVNLGLEKYEKPRKQKPISPRTKGDSKLESPPTENETDLRSSVTDAHPADENSDAAILSTCEVNVKRSRYVSSPRRKEVWFRAGNQCEYVDPVTGRRCSCRHGLQVDHIIEFSKGGSHALENLRLLCGAHNRWRSRATG